jgi:CheY-like chemotaxis protein
MDGDTLSAPCPSTVLVVEDNIDAAESAAVLLRLHGHQVTVAHDGVEALQAAERIQPDVVLLDIGLPKLSGWEVAKALRERPTRKRPLLVAITGYNDGAARERSAEAGIDLHLAKPVDWDFLLPRITNCMRV